MNANQELQVGDVVRMRPALGSHAALGTILTIDRDIDWVLVRWQGVRESWDGSTDLRNLERHDVEPLTPPDTRPSEAIEGWADGTARIVLAPPPQTHEIAALVRGPWAIHRTLQRRYDGCLEAGDTWTLTHRPTGWTLTPPLRTPARAAALADDLAAYCADWGAVTASNVRELVSPEITETLARYGARPIHPPLSDEAEAYRQRAVERGCVLKPAP